MDATSHLDGVATMALLYTARGPLSAGGDSVGGCTLTLWEWDLGSVGGPPQLNASVLVSSEAGVGWRQSA